MKALPRIKVNEAKRLMSDGLSIRETARRLHISPASACRIRAECEKNEPGTMLPNKGGRPRKLSKEMVDYIKISLKRGTLKTAVDATNTVNKVLPEPLSPVTVSTVRRCLKEEGLLAKKRVRRPALKKKHLRGRMPSRSMTSAKSTESALTATSGPRIGASRARDGQGRWQ
ncbi:hypothetical protein EDD11_008327 [Mortierella claussenii]|nr:hypothetical protein EDD11_008327 [Mortierella claussenii]